MIRGRKQPRSGKVVADVCLYGNRETGAGWIAAAAGLLLGDGEPVRDRCFTVAVWMGVEALRSAGVTGLVRIFDSGGTRHSKPYSIGHGVPAYGDIEWEQISAVAS